MLDKRRSALQRCVCVAGDTEVDLAVKDGRSPKTTDKFDQVLLRPHRREQALPLRGRQDHPRRGPLRPGCPSTRRRPASTRSPRSATCRRGSTRPPIRWGADMPAEIPPGPGNPLGLARDQLVGSRDPLPRDVGDLLARLQRVARMRAHGERRCHRALRHGRRRHPDRLDGRRRRSARCTRRLPTRSSCAEDEGTEQAGDRSRRARAQAQEGELTDRRRPAACLRRGGPSPLLRLLPAVAGAAGSAAPDLRSAGPRRAAVHRHPPGLRAVVQADPVRARVAIRDAFTAGDDPSRSSLSPAGPRDRTRADRADRGARNDVAAGLPRVPHHIWRRPAGSSRCQFREIEFLSGRKDDALPGTTRPRPPTSSARLEKRLAEPTLWDAFCALLDGRGLPMPADDEVGRRASLLTMARDREQIDVFYLSESLADLRRALRVCGGNVTC